MFSSGSRKSRRTTTRCTDDFRRRGRTLLEKFDRHFAHIYLSGFSAGYGAIRAILRQRPDSIDGILLLDGLHEIFPGTFASTTETAEYLIHDLGFTPIPVQRWGPLGMQQISDARRGGFVVLGFAGNSAPDHVDHFHAMPQFLPLLW